MPDTIRKFNDRPIWWQDKAGVTHICEGAEVHRDVRLFWTLCERDVPANASFMPGTGDKVTCESCLGLAT